MVDVGFEAQFDRLCKLIEYKFKRPVRVGLQTLDKPKKPDSDDVDYPFYGYNIVSARKVQSSPFQDKIENDMLIKQTNEMWQFTILFGCISDDMFKSMDGAQALHNWLSDSGRYDLKANKIAYVSITPVTQRDAFLVVNIERRYGFEVTFRMGRVVTTSTTFIEKASATGDIRKY